MTDYTEIDTEFDKEFVFISETNDETGHYDKPCLNTENPNHIKSFLHAVISREVEKAVKDERERIKNLIHERKKEWCKDCLINQFINGRFWEAQDIWEKISSLTSEEKI